MANFESEKSNTFNFSNNLFIDSSTSRPLQFHMMPCPHRAILQPMVEFGGGSLSAAAKDGILIRLLLPGQTSRHDDNYSYKYIHDCVEQNQLLDLEQYRIPVGQTVTAYSSAKEKDIEENFCVRLEGSSGRTKYTAEEERAILNALLEDEQYKTAGGIVVWKELETLKTTQHSWQSMKDHFRRIILPNIDSYNLPEEQKQLLLSASKKASSNESNSSDTDSRAPVATSSSTCQISLRSRAANATSSADELGQESHPAVDTEECGTVADSGSSGSPEERVTGNTSAESADNGQSETTHAGRTVDPLEPASTREGPVEEQSPGCLRKSPDAHSTPSDSRLPPASTDSSSPARVIGTIQVSPNRMVETMSDGNVARAQKTRGRSKQALPESSLQLRGPRATGVSAAVAGNSKSLDGVVSSKSDDSRSLATTRSWPDGRTKAARLLKFAKSQVGRSEKEDLSKVLKGKLQGKPKPVEEENEPRKLRSSETSCAVATRSASADGQTESKKLRSADRSDSYGQKSAASSANVSPVRQRQIPVAAKVKSSAVPSRAVDVDTEARSPRSSPLITSSSRSHAVREGKMSPKSTEKKSEDNASRRTAKAAAAATSTKDVSSRGPQQSLRSVNNSEQNDAVVKKWLRSGKSVSATSESNKSPVKTLTKRKLPAAQLEAKRPKSAEPVAGPSGLHKASASKRIAEVSSNPAGAHVLRNRVVESPVKPSQSKTKDVFAFSAREEPVTKASSAFKIRPRLLTKVDQQSAEHQSSNGGKVNGKSVAASGGAIQSSTSRGKGKASRESPACRPAATGRTSTSRVSIEGVVERHESSLRNIVLNDRALETSDDEVDSYSDVEPSTDFETTKKQVELIKMIATDLNMSFKKFMQAVCINNGNVTEAEHWVRFGTNRPGKQAWDPANDDRRLLHGDEPAFLSLVNKYGNEAVQQRLRFLTC